MARSNAAKKNTPVQPETVQPETVQPETVQPTVIPFTESELSTEIVTRIPLDRLRLNPDNVSNRFDVAREEDKHFLNSIQATDGELLTPITVVPNGDGTYTVVRGNRRTEALQVLVNDRAMTVPWVRCLLHPKQDHVEMLYDMDTSNNQAPLSQYQAGEIYAKLKLEGQTIPQIVYHTGRSDRHIETCLHLATAPAFVKDMWGSGRISETLSLLIFSESGGTVHGWSKAASILKLADDYFPREVEVKDEEDGTKRTVKVKIQQKALESARYVLKDGKPVHDANGQPIWISARTLKRQKDAADRIAKDATKQPEQPKQPDATKPDATKPDATKPDATKPDATKPDATKPDATKQPVTPPAPSEPKMVLCYEAEGTNVFHIRNTGKREGTAHAVASNPGNAQRIALALNFFVSFGPDSAYRVVKK